MPRLSVSWSPGRETGTRSHPTVLRSRGSRPQHCLLENRRESISHHFLVPRGQGFFQGMSPCCTPRLKQRQMPGTHTFAREALGRKPSELVWHRGRQVPPEQAHLHRRGRAERGGQGTEWGRGMTWQRKGRGRRLGLGYRLDTESWAYFRRF